ncbi:hypothetical protein SH203_02764 [Brevundimonas sp. SH203]|uniref:hypothetical protein n=1 Tax=Brevundimonas sp. SH203 TaxID=345167 RepID=UPI0009D47AFF|nr:hypothetical protein [Brevundimonas sp. SH203]GAW42348.1 hypothetical protein SH203_02764 [Brevundimonas sp. SH203]
MTKLMLKTAVALAVLAGAGTAVAAPPSAPATQPAATQSRDGHDRHVTIKNRTGWTMLRFYASDSRTDDWEEDILGEDVLEDGQNVRINIDDGSGACVYDFKAEFTNGQELTRSRINVCEISDYTYTR